MLTISLLLLPVLDHALTLVDFLERKEISSFMSNWNTLQTSWALYKEINQLQEKTAKFWSSLLLVNYWVLANYWPLTRFRLLNFPSPILQIFDQRVIIIHWKIQEFMIMLGVAFQQVLYPSMFHFHDFSSCIHCCL